MKTLEQIKEEVKCNYVFENGESAIVEDVTTDRFYNEVARRYAIEVTKQTQRNCAENAKLTGDWSFEHHDYINSVDKDSILSETNIPKLD